MKYRLGRRSEPHRWSGSLRPEGRIYRRRLAIATTLATPLADNAVATHGTEDRVTRARRQRNYQLVERAAIDGVECLDGRRRRPLSFGEVTATSAEIAVRDVAAWDWGAVQLTLFRTTLDPAMGKIEAAVS